MRVYKIKKRNTHFSQEEWEALENMHCPFSGIELNSYASIMIESPITIELLFCTPQGNIKETMGDRLLSPNWEYVCDIEEYKKKYCNNIFLDKPFKLTEEQKKQNYLSMWGNLKHY